MSTLPRPRTEDAQRDLESPGSVRGGVSTVDVAQLVEPRVVIPAVVGSSPIVHPIQEEFGPLAQLVEQETLNLLVVGSIPTRPTTFQGLRS